MKKIGKRIGCTVLAAQMILAPAAQAAPLIQTDMTAIPIIRTGTEKSRSELTLAHALYAKAGESSIRPPKLKWYSRSLNDTLVAVAPTEKVETFEQGEESQLSSEADVATEDEVGVDQETTSAVQESMSSTETAATIVQESTSSVEASTTPVQESALSIEAATTSPQESTPTTPEDMVAVQETTSLNGEIMPVVSEKEKTTPAESVEPGQEERIREEQNISTEEPAPSDTTSALSNSEQEEDFSDGSTASVDEEKKVEGLQFFRAPVVKAQSAVQSTVSPMAIAVPEKPPVRRIYAAFGFGVNYEVGQSGTLYNFEGNPYVGDNGDDDATNYYVNRYSTRLKNKNSYSTTKVWDTANDNIFNFNVTDGKEYFTGDGAVLPTAGDFPRLPNLKFTENWYAVKHIDTWGNYVYVQNKIDDPYGLDFKRLNCDQINGNSITSKQLFKKNEDLDQYETMGYLDDNKDLLIVGEWAPSSNAKATDLKLYNAATYNKASSSNTSLELYPVATSVDQNQMADMTLSELKTHGNSTTKDAKDVLTTNLTATDANEVRTFFARVDQGIEDLVFTLDAFEPDSILEISADYSTTGKSDYTHQNYTYTYTESGGDRTETGDLHVVNSRTFDSDGIPQNSAENPARGKWSFNGNNTIHLETSTSSVRYNVVTFTITAPDMATQKTYTVYIQRLAAPEMKLDPGNTPVGMIWRHETWDESKKTTEESNFKNANTGAGGYNRTFNANTAPGGAINNSGYVQYGQYTRDAWGQRHLEKDGQGQDQLQSGAAYDGDLDQGAIVVYQNSDFHVPSVTIYDALGDSNRVTDSNIGWGLQWSLTVDTVNKLVPEVAQDAKLADGNAFGVTYGTKTWSGDGLVTDYISMAGENVKPGLYKLKYTYTDVYDGLPHTVSDTYKGWQQKQSDDNDSFYRTVIVLPIRGDVDMDGLVTPADGVALRTLLDSSFFSDVKSGTSTDVTKCLYWYRVCDVDGLADSSGRFAENRDVAKLYGEFKPDDGKELAPGSNNNYFYLPLPSDMLYTRRRSSTSDAGKPTVSLKYLGVDTEEGLKKVGVDYDRDQNKVFWVDIQLSAAPTGVLADNLSTVTFTLSYDPTYVTPYVAAGKTWFETVLDANSQWAGWSELYSNSVAEPAAAGSVTARTKALPNLDQTTESKLREVRFVARAPEGANQKLVAGSLLKVPFQLSAFPRGKTEAKLVELTLGGRDFAVTTSAGFVWNNGSTNGADGPVNATLSSATTNLADQLQYGGSDAILLGEDLTPVYIIYTTAGKNPVYGESFTSNTYGVYKYKDNGVEKTKKENIPSFGSSGDYTITMLVNGQSWPDGVTYNYTSGTLSNTSGDVPNAAGVYEFTITSVNSATAGIPFRLVIEKAPLTLAVQDVSKYYGESISPEHTTSQYFTYDVSQIKQRDKSKNGVSCTGDETELPALLNETGEAYERPEISLVTGYTITSGGTIDETTPVTGYTKPGTETVLIKGGSSKNYQFYYTQKGKSEPDASFGTADLNILKRPLRVDQIVKNPAASIQQSQKITDRPGEAKFSAGDFTLEVLTVDADGNYTNPAGKKAPLTVGTGKSVYTHSGQASDEVVLSYVVEVITKQGESRGAFVIAGNKDKEARDGKVKKIELSTDTAVENRNDCYELVNGTNTTDTAYVGAFIPANASATTQVTKLAMSKVEIAPATVNLVKTSYVYGEGLDLTHLLVYGHWDDGNKGEAEGSVANMTNANNMGLRVHWVAQSGDIPGNDAPTVSDNQELTVAYHNGKYICISGPDDSTERAWLGPFTVTPHTLTLTIRGESNSEYPYSHLERYYGETIPAYTVEYNRSELSSWDQARLPSTPAGDLSDLAFLTGFDARHVVVTPRVSKTQESDRLVGSADIGTYYVVVDGASAANYAFQYTRTEIGGSETTAAVYGYIPLVVRPRPILVTLINSQAGTIYHDTDKPSIESATAVIAPHVAEDGSVSAAVGFVAELPSAYVESYECNVCHQTTPVGSANESCALTVNCSGHLVAIPDTSTIYIDAGGNTFRATLPLNNSDPVYKDDAGKIDSLTISYDAAFKTDTNKERHYFDMGTAMHKDVDVYVSNITLQSTGSGGNYVLLFANVEAQGNGWLAKATNATQSVTVNGGGVDLKKIVDFGTIMPPSKREYTYGETLSLDGMSVVLRYIDGTSYNLRYMRYGETSEWKDTFEQQGLKVNWVFSGGETAVHGQRITVADHNAKSLFLTGPTYKDASGQDEAPIEQLIPNSKITVLPKELHFTVKDQARYYGQKNGVYPGPTESSRQAVYEFTFDAGDLSEWDKKIMDDAGLGNEGSAPIPDPDSMTGAPAVSVPAACAALSAIDSSFVGPTFYTSADEKSDASDVPYTLTLSGGSMVNYTLIETAGGITVNKRPIMVTNVVKNPVKVVSEDFDANKYYEVVCYQNTPSTDNDGNPIILNELTLAPGANSGLSDALVNGDGIAVNIKVKFEPQDPDIKFSDYDKLNKVYEKKPTVMTSDPALLEGGKNDNYVLSTTSIASQSTRGLVHRREIASIEIWQTPSKVHYTYGEVMDLNGMKIRVHYVQPAASEGVTLDDDTFPAGDMDNLFITYISDPDNLPDPADLSTGTNNAPTELLTLHPAATGDHLTIATKVDQSGDAFAHDKKYLMVASRIANRQGFVTPVAKDTAGNAIQIEVAPRELTYNLTTERKDYDHTTQARGTIKLNNVYGTDQVWVVNGTDYYDTVNHPLPAGYTFQSANYGDYQDGSDNWANQVHYGHSADGIKFTFVDANVKWETTGHDLYQNLRQIPVEVTNITLDGADSANYHINDAVTTSTIHEVGGRDPVPNGYIDPITRPSPDMAIDLAVDVHTNTVKVLPMKSVEDFRDLLDQKDGEQHFEYALIYVDEETDTLQKTPYQDDFYFGGEEVTVDVPVFEASAPPKERPKGTGGGQTLDAADGLFGTNSRTALPRGTYVGALVRLAKTNNYNVSDGTPSVRNYDPTSSIVNDEDLDHLRTALETAGAAMDAVYAAIPSPENQQERIPERVQGTAVKTYTYRIDVVSTSEEFDTQSKKHIVPILEEVWFTDQYTFKTENELNRLIENNNPTLYYGFFWDASQKTKVELGEEKFDLRQDIKIEIPLEDDPGQKVLTLMNQGGTVRFYVPVYPSSSGGEMPTKVVIDLPAGVGGGGAIGGAAETENTGIVLHVGDDPVELKVSFDLRTLTNKRVYWRSTNDAVVQVSDMGVVTPIGPGEAEIQVRSYMGGLTDTIKVTVLPKEEVPQVPFADTMFNAGYEGAFMGLSGDGLFEPNRRVTRKELIVIMAHFFRNVEGVDLSALKKYIDVPPSAEYMDSLRLLEEHGIVNGVSSNMFAPNWYATRAEISTILSRMLMLPLSTEPNVPHAFVDATPEKHWAWVYIDALAEAGITRGTGNGEYSPERVLTRAEVAVFIARALVTRANMNMSNLRIPADVPAGHWAYESVLLAVNGGTMDLISAP